MPCGLRCCEPAKITSSARRVRRDRFDCSPSTQRTASAMLLLPDPFGPMTALTPGSKTKRVGSANVLKPCSRSSLSRLTPPPPTPTSEPSAAAAACSSARCRLEPTPIDSRSPRRTAATVKVCSCAGPVCVHQLIVWLEPMLALRPFLQSALGRLRRLGLLGARQLGAEQSGAASRRVISSPSDRKIAPASASKAAASSEGRVAPPASASPRPSRRYRSRPISRASAASASRLTSDGAPGGQQALVLVREALVEEAADDQADDGVAQELEALVVARDGVWDSR